MPQQVEFVLDAKEAGAVRAWLAVQRAADQFNASLQKTGDIQEQNSRSGAEWQAKAKKLLADLETPMERHNRKLEEYNQLRSRGLIGEEKFAAAVRKSKIELDGATSSGAKAGDMASAFGTKVAGVAASIASVATVAGILKSEYDDLLKRQGKAAETQITLAQAQRMAVFNLGNDPTLSPQQMVEEARGISARTGVDETSVTRLLSDSFSARGKMSARDILPFAENVLKMAPDISGQPMMGGATLDLAKAFGANPEQAFGMMMQVGSASRVTDLNSMAQNVVPAMVSIGTFGDSAEQSGELVAALTQASADKTGASSSTAAVQLAGRLAKLLPNLKNTEERIAAVRGDKRLQEAIFKEDFGEERFKPLFRQLLTGDETTATVQAYRAAQGTVGSLDAGAALSEELRKNYEGLPTAKTAAVDRGLRSLADRLRAGDDFGGKSGVSRKGLADVLEAANVPEITRKIVLGQFDAATQLGGRSPLEESASALESQAAQLVATSVRGGSTVGVGFGGMTVGSFDRTRQPTAENRAVSDSMIEVATALRELQKTMQENNKEVKENNAILQGDGVPPVKGPRPLLPVQANDIRFKGQFLPPGDQP